ncbi:helix-turn-helix domain-containing protein [bacterium]|jgi:excisionase family DNA binding protein|nr:helix-turn-helix domain-containing protein [bacterium]
MEILNKDDVATYLKVSIKTVRYLLYSKQLPKIKVGKEYRFLKSDIDSWIQKKRQGVKTFSFKGAL